MRPKNYFVKKIGDKKKWVKNLLRVRNFVAQIFFGKKQIGPQKIFGNLCAEANQLCSKTVRIKIILVKQNIRGKN